MSAEASGLADTCPICEKALDSQNVTVVGEKGAQGINTASKERGDDIIVSAGVTLHTSCRKSYTNKKDIHYMRQSIDGESSAFKRSARLSLGPFDSQSDCVLCGTNVVKCSSAIVQPKDRSYSSCVKTDTFVAAMLDCCNSRIDKWSEAVNARIEYYRRDLHATDCLYHHTCSVNFRTGRDVPLQFQVEPSTKRRKPGRPLNEDQEQAFLKTCDYLQENDDEQLTLSNLSNKMGEFLLHSDAEPYGNQYLKSKLQEHYGQSIDISTEEGLTDIVSIREKTDQILRSYFLKAKEGDEQSQKRNIIETAAKFIKSDIKTQVRSVKDEYPNVDELKIEQSLQYVPISLRLLLENLFAGNDTRRKVAAIGQAIVQSTRPRSVVTPLQLGLAAQMQYLFRSRFLIDTLNTMGFSSTYNEALRFEKNAACAVAPDVLGKI